MRRLGLHQLDTIGAAAGDVPTYDPATDSYVPAAGGTAGGGAGLTVQDENGQVATDVTTLDFQGPGFTAAAGAAGEVILTSYGAPVLLLADGDAIPTGTPAGAIIMRKA